MIDREKMLADVRRALGGAPLPIMERAADTTTEPAEPAQVDVTVSAMPVHEYSIAFMRDADGRLIGATITPVRKVDAP